MFDSIIIRPVQLSDLSKLVDLLDTLSDSLTSMPKDESVLEKRIHKSIQSFYPGISEAGPEQYLFVMEDLSTGKIVGTSSIIARVGGYEPFYTYRIENETIEHKPLGVSKTIQALHLEANHNGPSEIGSLFIHPKYRKGGLGRLLSLSRFLFATKYESRFRTKVIAELRGFLNDEGKSPFWENVGLHFFDQEFSEADFLSGIGNKEFIRDLMPKHPIYLPLLPQAIQEIVGQVHPDTEPAKAILMKEGFKQTNTVDIFDAGPMFEVNFEDLRCTRNMQKCEVVEIRDCAIETSEFIISNGELDFKCCLGEVELRADTGCSLSQRVANLLDLKIGNEVLFTSVR